MPTSYLVTHAGLPLDVAQIKCFKLSPFHSGTRDTRQFLVELKTRVEFVRHPGTGQWEKKYFAEQLEQEFPSYDTAQAYLREWEEIWQNYLDA